MTGPIRRRAERVALVGLLLSGTGTLFYWYTAGACRSLAARAEIFHLLTATLIWGVSLLHLRARRVAAEEREHLEEAERIRAEEGRQSLFDETGREAGVAQERLREMEKYGAPLASILIILTQLVFGGYFLYGLAYLGTRPDIGALVGMSARAELTDAAFGAAVSFAVAFASFALGMYAAGMARDGRVRLLRAGAGYSIGAAAVGLLLTFAFGLGYSGWLTGERVLAWAAAILLVVLGLEMAINFVLDFYRPRARGEEPRPVYDSRLTGLLAEPQSIFRTFAHTLDYQFGFRVSETWFFRFLNQAIAPLILFQLASLYLLTCLVIVQPGEVAVIERWGRPRGVDRLPPAPTIAADDDARARMEAQWDAISSHYGPGFHLKWPWPIEVVRRAPLHRVQEAFLGAPQRTEAQRAAWERRQGDLADVVSWDKEHVKGEFRYVMPLTKQGRVETEIEALQGEQALEARDAPDAMFISGAIGLHYTVGRPSERRPGEVRSGDVYRYLYRYADPGEALVSLAEQELTSTFAGEDFWEVLVEELEQKEADLRRRIQAAADRAGLGVQIIFVSLSNMHPPVGEVGQAFQEVISAREQKLTAIHNARAAAAEIMAGVPGESVKLVEQAKGYRDERVMVAEARARRFRQQMHAYDAAPGVYLHRERMRALAESLPDVGKLSIVPEGVVAAVDTRQDITEGLVGQTLMEEIETQ